MGLKKPLGTPLMMNEKDVVSTKHMIIFTQSWWKPNWSMIFLKKIHSTLSKAFHISSFITISPLTP